MFLKDSDQANKFGTFTYLYAETNFWIGHYPPKGYRLSLSLQNADGKSVEKTKEGNAISKPIGLIVKTKIRMHSTANVLPQKIPERYEGPFNLLNCFKLEKAGTYVLTVGATLFKRKDDGDVYEIGLPPVAIKVTITQADIDTYRAAAH
jgi:hypothetical protein